MTAFVYRMYAADGALLYIGSTTRLADRMGSHRAHARWWEVMDDFTLERYATETEAREAELKAIESECPRWNIHGRSQRHPDGPASTYRDILANYPQDCRWRAARMARAEGRIA